MDEEESTDTFPVHYILLPCFCLSFVINYQFTVMSILWSFSILLEAVAILPQLHMLKRTGQAEALTRYYIISLGTYRALYILNWVYRYVSLSLSLRDLRPELRLF
jgi:ER lumen protein retaining receptor